MVGSDITKCHRGIFSSRAIWTEATAPAQSNGSARTRSGVRTTAQQSVACQSRRITSVIEQLSYQPRTLAKPSNWLTHGARGAVAPWLLELRRDVGSPQRRPREQDEREDRDRRE